MPRCRGRSDPANRTDQSSDGRRWSIRHRPADTEGLMPETRLSFPQGYEALQGNLKNRIRAAHVKGAGGPPSVRIIICKTRNKVGAEYALRDLRKPVGVAEYRLT